MKFKEYKKIIEKIMEVSEQERETIQSPEQVRMACLEYSTQEQEHFILLTLNGASQIINKHCITKGLVNRTQVHPREVFRQAILDNAVAIIIVHNHPSGQLTPSIEDSKITKIIKESGEILAIQLLDHVIIGPTEKYFSYGESERL